MEDRNRALATLSAVTAAGSLMLDVQELLESSLVVILSALDLPAGGIFLREPEGGPNQLTATRGLSDDLRGQLSLSATDPQPLARVAVASGPIVLDLVAERFLRQSAVQEIAERRYLMGVPLTARGVAHGVLFVTSPVREALDDHAPQLLTTVGQQLGVAIQGQRLYRAQQRRAEQFRVISEVGRRITSSLDVQEVVGEIVGPLHERLGYSLVGIGLIEGDQAVMKAGAGASWDRPGHPPPRFRIGQEGLIRVAAEGVTLLVPEDRLDPTYVAFAGSGDTRSELVIPLRTQQAVMGVLDVQSDRTDAFDEDDRAVLESLAAQAAVAIANAHLYARAREAAVLEKRNRLARDLHDAVSQRLWTASLLAEVVPDQVRDAQQEAMHNLARLRQLTRGALAETRMLLLELRPAAPQRAELGELLRQLADRVSSRKKLDIHLDVQRHRAPPAEVKIGLYRIASEALSNAAKHARATQAWIGLSGGQVTVPLELRDNSRGFDPGLPRADGLGLSVMRERAQAIGGMLEIESAPGLGTRIAVHWPAHEGMKE